MSAGPWLLAKPWPVMIKGTRVDLPAGTVVQERGVFVGHRRTAIVGPEELWVVGADAGDPELTDICVPCYADNGDCTAADMETNQGTPCCGGCVIDTETREGWEIGQRRQDQHEAAADALNDQRRDER